MSYKIVRNISQSEIVINKSRFIGECFPVDDEADALERIKSVRKKYYDAKHHCFAFCIGENYSVIRCSDDGEPSGTAGQPILNLIQSKGFSNTLCVVTRYFGGILLGTGGLVRAYTEAASSALDKAEIAVVQKCARCSLSVSYPDWARVEKTINDGGGIIENSSYSEIVTVFFVARHEDAARISKQVFDVTNGKSAVDFVETVNLPF